MTKTSLKKEFNDCKKEIEALKKSGEIPPKLLPVITMMMQLLSVVMVMFLEKKTRKNSSNSGLPPSQDFGSNGNRNKKGSKEEDVQERKPSRLDNVKDTESSETITPTKCSGCGADLTKSKVIDTEERKEIDIVYEVHEHTVISEVKECSECGQENIGEFPKGMDGLIQYGIGIKAAIINFLTIQMLSLQRVQEHFHGLLGRNISPRVMLKYISQLGASLEAWEKEVKKQLLTVMVVHLDETSMRVNKKTYWIHTYSCGDIVLQFIHPSRGRDAIEDIDFLGKYKGIIVHDCWGPYFTYEGVTHALCLAHILRELKFVEENTQGHWATKLKELLQEAIALVNQRKKRKTLTDKEYKKLQRRYRYILTQALQELPPFPKRKKGQKGRVKHTDAQNLWLRLVEYEEAVLLFARVKEVDPTNNRAERDLRMNKVKKKVSGCFRTEEMAKHFCRITSYVKTMRNKGYSSLEAISMALKGEIPM